MNGLMSIYRRSGTIILEGASLTVDKMTVINGCVRVLTDDISDGDLGRAVEQMADTFQDDTPSVDRAEINRRLGAVLDALAVKSYTAFLKGTTGLLLDALGDTITLTPMLNGGESGRDKGFTFLTDHEATISKHVEPELLGKAVREALGHAR